MSIFGSLLGLKQFAIEREFLKQSQEEPKPEPFYLLRPNGSGSWSLYYKYYLQDPLTLRPVPITDFLYEFRTEEEAKEYIKNANRKEIVIPIPKEEECQ